MSMHSAIEIAVDAETAYRRERVANTFRPWRRVGGERFAARRTGSRGSDAARTHEAVASSVITISR